MSTKRMDEQAVTAFMELFFSDNPRSVRQYA